MDTGNETRDERIQEREDFFEAGTLPEKRVTARWRATG